MDPEWTRTDWSRVRAVVDRLSPVEIDRALEALRGVFPPTLVNELRSTHPVAAEQHFVTGRFTLLELGHAIDRLGTAKDRQRLRQPAEYASTAAELRAALMFTRAGARISRPEHEKGIKEYEFLAEFPNGHKLAVEVKLPREGARQRLYQTVESRLLFGLMERLTIPRDTPARATIRFAQDVADILPEDIDHHLNTAAAQITAALAIEQFQTIQLGPIGSITIVSDSSSSGLQFDALSFSRNQAAEDHRVRRSALAKAARQLATTTYPGVLILDSELNSLLRNSIPFLRRWTSSQEHLAATILVDRMCPDLRLYGSVDPIQGPRFRAAAPLFKAWELCRCHHLHYCALCSVVEPCPCEGWFTKLVRLDPHSRVARKAPPLLQSPMPKRTKPESLNLNSTGAPAKAVHGSKSAFVRSMPPGTSAKEIVAIGRSKGIKLSISQIYNIRAVDKKRDEGKVRKAPTDAQTLKSTAQPKSVRVKVAGDEGDEARLRKLIAEVGLARSREVIAEVARAFGG